MSKVYTNKTKQHSDIGSVNDLNTRHGKIICKMHFQTKGSSNGSLVSHWFYALSQNVSLSGSKRAYSYLMYHMKNTIYSHLKSN